MYSPSPNGHWLGYYLLESGSYEVYVTAFPEGGTRWLIHPDGRTVVMVRPAADVGGQVTLVVNWHEELKRLVPAQ
jgi:hypothetical protein